MSKPVVPGTYLFGLEEGRKGLGLNTFCASLTIEANRERFLADEAAYCREFALTPEQLDAVLRRDWTSMLELGGSIFYVFKLAMVDKKSMQYLGGIFTGMTTEEFVDALSKGGRHFG